MLQEEYYSAESIWKKPHLHRYGSFRSIYKWL